MPSPIKKAKRNDKKKQQRRVNNNIAVFLKKHNTELHNNRQQVRLLSQIISGTLMYIDTCTKINPEFKPDEMLALRNETNLLRDKYILLAATYRDIPEKITTMEQILEFTTANIEFVELAALTEKLRESARELFTEYDKQYPPNNVDTTAVSNNSPDEL